MEALQDGHRQQIELAVAVQVDLLVQGNAVRDAPTPAAFKGQQPWCEPLSRGLPGQAVQFAGEPCIA